MITHHEVSTMALECREAHIRKFSIDAQNLIKRSDRWDKIVELLHVRINSTADAIYLWYQVNLTKWQMNEFVERSIKTYMGTTVKTMHGDVNGTPN